MVDAPDGRLVSYARVFWDDLSEGYRAYYLVFEAASNIDGLADRVLDWGVDRASAIAAGHDRRRQAHHHVVRRRGERRDRNSSHRRLHSVRVVGRRWSDRTSATSPTPRCRTAWRSGRSSNDDLRAIWEVDIEAFRDHRGYVEQDETDCERFLDEARRGTSLWQVAWAGDVVAGQVRTRVNDGEDVARGRRRAWTEDISTCREWRGKGVASALIASSLRQLAALGFDEAALGVDLDNPTGALGVYQRLGYEVVLRVTQYSRPA